MSGPIDNLLSRLDGVRRTQAGGWVARCPVHEDRTPSLGVREGDDGRLLLFCRAGCATVDVVAALGLEIADLYPPRLDRAPGAGTTRLRRPWSAADLVVLAAAEAHIVALVACDIAAGVVIGAEDRDRVLDAAGSLLAMVEATGARA